ncbi:putative amino-acid efflux transporter [Octadecabacter antarcticus 307]|uniref:Putative amino-acid efflux transporter n=1 Tax=Octadecabacter antarcticus 307 TaxID=391626 RepID=M9R7E9_9RHOB|nr:LysE family transporter [Octadecabacter antarcticus]AGI68152.1 putative amino-acid efflux transporter [Octadecabacter antarcticus 307]
MTNDFLILYLPSLLVILTIFTVGVASPGPATLMILGTAMSCGRSSAVALSLGVVTGSLFWGCVAAFGFVAAIKASMSLFTAMKLAGGLYLFYLAFRSWRSALTANHSLQVQSATIVSLRRSYVRGLLLHLTNPKAPLVWLATLSVGLDDTAPLPFLVLAIVLCELVAIIVFVGYAFLFSTPTASQFYISFRRPFDAALGLLFGAAAIKILTSRVN